MDFAVLYVDQPGQKSTADPEKKTIQWQQQQKIDENKYAHGTCPAPAPVSPACAAWNMKMYAAIPHMRCAKMLDLLMFDLSIRTFTGPVGYRGTARQRCLP